MTSCLEKNAALANTPPKGECLFRDMAALGELFSSQFKAAGNTGEGDSQDPPSVYIKQETGEQKMSGTVDSFSEPFTLISSTAEVLGSQAAEHANSRGLLGHISSGKDWIASKHSKVQPWAEFFNVKKFSLPRGAGDLTTRLLGNLQRFQSNYLFVFLGLVVYCM